MKYALISDIHANLPALEAVLADIRDRQEVAAPTTSVTWSDTRHGRTRR
jgi:hypothetical protein